MSERYSKSLNFCTEGGQLVYIINEIIIIVGINRTFQICPIKHYDSKNASIKWLHSLNYDETESLLYTHCTYTHYFTYTLTIISWFWVKSIVLPLNLYRTYLPDHTCFCNVEEGSTSTSKYLLKSSIELSLFVKLTYGYFTIFVLFYLVIVYTCMTARWWAMVASSLIALSLGYRYGRNLKWKLLNTITGVYSILIIWYMCAQDLKIL